MLNKLEKCVIHKNIDIFRDDQMKHTVEIRSALYAFNTNNINIHNCIIISNFNNIMYMFSKFV